MDSRIGVVAGRHSIFLIVHFGRACDSYIRGKILAIDYRYADCS
jgi:hypothetical protein